MGFCSLPSQPMNDPAATTSQGAAPGPPAGADHHPLLTLVHISLSLSPSLSSYTLRKCQGWGISACLYMRSASLAGASNSVAPCSMCIRTLPSSSLPRPVSSLYARLVMEASTLQHLINQLFFILFFFIFCFAVNGDDSSIDKKRIEVSMRVLLGCFS